MRTTLATLLAAATGLVLLGGAAPAVAADTVRIKPGALDRGPDVVLPHLEGRTIVDGELEVEVPGRGHVRLVGASGDDYLVQTWTDRGRYRAKRVTAGGDVTVLKRGGSVMSLALSTDGALFTTESWRRGRTTVSVHDAADGSRLHGRSFRGAAFVLDLDAERVLLGSWGPDRTFWWDLQNGTKDVIRKQTGYAADITADRVAWYTKDPYQGGCSVVASLGDPDTRLARLCRQRVTAFSPDGRRLATVHILSDGLGPGEVQLRKDTGRLLVKYDAQWFGEVRWEDADSLLLDAHGRKKMATVRCEGTSCERASRLRRTSIS